MKKVSFNNLKIRDPETGKFTPLMAIRGESAYDIAVRLGKFSGTEEEWNKALETERAAAVASIEQKGAETLASIPEDYTALAEAVEGKFDKANIAQELGDRPDMVVSQKAATNLLDGNFEWEQGGIDANGDDTTDNARCRIKGFVPTNTTKIFAKEGYLLTYHIWQRWYNYLGFITNKGEYPDKSGTPKLFKSIDMAELREKYQKCHFKIIVMKADTTANITPEEVAQNVSFQTKAEYEQFNYNALFSKFENTSILKIKNKKVMLDGTIEAAGSINISNYIDVEPMRNKALYVSGLASELNLISYFDENKTFISGDGATYNIVDGSLIGKPSNSVYSIVPDTAKYAIVQGNPNHKFIFAGYTGVLPEPLKDGCQVNDGLTQTSASAVELAFDKKYGIVFLAYLASQGTYGEQRGTIALSFFPLNQPHNCKTVVISNNSGDFEPNILSLGNGVVRVLYVKSYSTNGEYCYKDYNFKTDTIGEEKIIQFNNGTSVVEMNEANYDAYVTAQGYSGFTAATASPSIIITSKLFEQSGKIYGAITSINHYPVLFYSEDNMQTLIPFALYNVLCAYEFTYVIKNGIIHSVARCSNGKIKYNKSEDNGATWQRWDLPDGVQCRPEITIHNGDVILLYNYDLINDSEFPDILLNRTAVRMMKVDESNLSNLTTLKEFYSKYGIVYVRTLSIYDDMYMAYSDSQATLETLNGGAQEQGKEAVRWQKIDM